MPRPLQLLVALPLLFTALACGGDTAGPADPDPDPDPEPSAELPIIWEFESDLEGWIPGTTPGSGDVTVSSGAVRMRLWGGPGVPNAWISRAVSLPAEAATLQVRAIANCVGTGLGGGSAMRVRLTTGGATSTLVDWVPIPNGNYYEATADLTPFAGAAVTIVVEADDEGAQEPSFDLAESLCVANVNVVAATGTSSVVD